MIEIVKDRPFIKAKKRASWKDYPFATLQIGESFYLEPGTFERKKFSVMIHSVGKRLSTAGSQVNGIEPVVVKFSTRSENGGMWVQRVS